MALYRGKNGCFSRIKRAAFSKEKELQTLIEGNIQEFLDMYFLASEYSTTFGGRIDTLAVDFQGAPVIIEYKRNKNDNVINQALSYLKWLRAQKSEFFEMLIVKNLDKSIAETIEIDWNNPRVVCIAESFNKYDLDTVEMVPLRIELYRYRLYENDLFSLEPVNVDMSSDVHLPPKRNGGATEPVESSEKFLEKADETVKSIYKMLRERIFELDENIKERVRSYYIAFAVTKNFAEFHIRKHKITIYLRQTDYPQGNLKVEKIPDSFNWTLGKRTTISDEAEIDEAFEVIKTSYQDVL